jgi:hypothetical protein
MEVVKEADIVIICMLSLYQNLSNDSFLLKCIFNIQNLNKKREMIVNKMILENSIDEITISVEMIEEIEIEGKKNVKEIEEIEKDHDQKKEKEEMNVEEDQDHNLVIPHWRESL